MSKTATELLRLVHRRPGLTRAEAARGVGTSSGAATEAVAALTGQRLLTEGEPTSAGRRGRPTRPLLPHPQGPVVLAAQISHRGWRVRVVELGGTALTEVGGAHDGSEARFALDAVRAAGRSALRRFGDRVRGAGLAVPGPVRAGHLLDAPLLDWHGVDLRAAWPGRLAQRSLAHANDARCAGFAESVRGRAGAGVSGDGREAGSGDAGLHVHLHLDAGLGGVVVRAGELLDGRHTAAGEFGHLPFGDPGRRCGCGAHGCWGLSLVESLDPAAAAGALGRGTAGLVNALDPDLVTLGGRAPGLLTREFAAAFERGLMDVRRADPPPVLATSLGEDGPLVGAAELVWAQLLA